MSVDSILLCVTVVWPPSHPSYNEPIEFARDVVEHCQLNSFFFLNRHRTQILQCKMQLIRSFFSIVNNENLKHWKHPMCVCRRENWKRKVTWVLALLLICIFCTSTRISTYDHFFEKFGSQMQGPWKKHQIPLIFQKQNFTLISSKCTVSLWWQSPYVHMPDSLCRSCYFCLDKK